MTHLFVLINVFSICIMFVWHILNENNKETKKPDIPSSTALYCVFGLYEISETAHFCV